MARKNARTTRTQAMLDDFRGSANEAQMLAGVLTMAHKWPDPDRIRFYRTVDTTMVANRLIELNRHAIGDGNVPAATA
ncbi:hypothetical protein [Burkholderia vietnamiensis]|uniref:hypothetical protein n=1 Tax=Burkholderia vietnamiensis TaxID=60552 RepID=UPI001BA3E0FD|nr:hypothetical protein [Burkholderia vietnamiensis]MBR8082505.1 hypothetical protein [Burkholderia vietnamiensis]MCA8287518.1 hypothetical protein [Burkholderia vietnamiensis]